MKIAIFARKKKHTHMPKHIVDALCKLGHDARLIHYGRWQSMLGDKNLSARFIEKGRETVEQRFALKTMVEGNFSVYSELLAGESRFMCPPA